MSENPGPNISSFPSLFGRKVFTRARTAWTRKLTVCAGYRAHLVLPKPCKLCNLLVLHVDNTPATSERV
ncbi:hypothetical protein DPMN_157927 [Dreissena polymorpha]|uniref:Uncharacterized protein n=1 Tax=Dreissena polymorpha TaxID=45954 RepID=A0A9D4EGY3_DREPO|nr:hypothetical protein DPMN_157927 [Dreissena polymorpha]